MIKFNLLLASALLALSLSHTTSWSKKFSREQIKDILIKIERGLTDKAYRRAPLGHSFELYDSKDPNVIPLLISFTSHKNEKIRFAAIFALAIQQDIREKIDKRSIAPFIAALNDKYYKVRWMAARALGGIEDPNIIASLIKALNDSHPRVKSEVISALKKSKNPKAQQAVQGLAE